MRSSSDVDGGAGVGVGVVDVAVDGAVEVGVEGGSVVSLSPPGHPAKADRLATEIPAKTRRLVVNPLMLH
jgi:hypothetical protein